MGNEMSAAEPFANFVQFAFQETAQGRAASPMPDLSMFFPERTCSSMPAPPFFPMGGNPVFPTGGAGSGASSSSSSPFGKGAASSAKRNEKRGGKKTAPTYNTDLERLDALLSSIHKEEFFDPSLGSSMSAKELRCYFAQVGVDKDSDGRKFVEVSDMRAAYARRAKLGVAELRRRLTARGICCDLFIERTDFEKAYAQVPRMCPICIDEYKAADCICALPCGHTYHFECVRQAARTELEMHQRWPRCPECRNDLNRAPSRLSSAEERPEKCPRRS
eukprot:TRINITY_DN75714_c0_g1_i1.p1 TRINITY_DN75714_c0_g1~~TRINITY_DN75714_c0_g1_i1.p1  ORF type:complete len:276 (-),score=48.88 TRINITY_DN75714_c0_g1_i1:155-982(-)